VKSANLALRFVLELCALAALAYWGWTVWWGLAVVMPVAFGLVWGWFVAPKRKVQTSEPVRWAIELVVFLGAAAALAATGQVVLGVVFAVAAVANGALVRVL
jgi:Protein of unknown function (DUF2568)